MAELSRVRLDLAFEGGQALSVEVDVESAEELDRALADGERESLSFEAADGRYTVAVRKVVYVRRYAREGRVGFGAVA